MLVYQIIISLAFLAMLSGLAAVIIVFINNKRKKIPFSDRFKYSTGAYFCILISILNWFFNVGDIRTILTVPIFIHTIIFFGVTFFASGYVEHSVALEKSVAMGILMFLFTHLLLPDFSKDVANTYFLFFRTIYSDSAATACMLIALIAFAVNIIMLVRQLYLTLRLR